MIAVILDKAGFEYDIHSLVKAFYPQSEVKVFLEGTKDIVSDEDLPMIRILRSSEEVTLLLSECGGGGLWKTVMRQAENVGRAETEGQTEVVRRAETPPLSADQEKSRLRNIIKRLLYRLLSAYTGKTLPWGTLTGIRPTKIAMGLLEAGWTEKAILTHMQEYYYAGDEKSRLSIEIAKREREILAGRDHAAGWSLYIGIPFCPTTCLYCSFPSYPLALWKERIEDYLTALEAEIDDTARAFAGNAPESIYIGGGTPTTLTEGELERLLAKICASFCMTQVREFTVEAGRADSITRGKLEIMRKYGVSRISVNPQTMNLKTLRLIGRQHTVEQVEEAFYLARECGFSNINMDLILGLPGEGREEAEHTARAVCRLKPDSLTVHCLAIKKGSRLNEWILENGYDMLRGADTTADTMMRIMARAAAQMDMKPYYLYRQKNISGNFENIGYATEGRYGLYNVLIMEEVQSIVALGAGSITKKVTKRASEGGRENILIERCENVKEAAQYIERIDEMIERKRRLFARAE